MPENKISIENQKAISSHDKNALLFADRYRLMQSDPYANAFVYGRKKLFEWLFPYLKKNIPAGAAVLDVGSGTGYLLYEFSKQGYQVTGVEPAPFMRMQASLSYPGITVKAGSVNKLEFPDNSFDAVTAIEVFRYLSPEDIRTGYSEILRVLKPGGVLIATLVNRYALDGFIFLYYARWLKEKLLGSPLENYCNFVTPGEMKRYWQKEFGLTPEMHAVLFAQLRMLYLLSPALGRWRARKLEKFDDWITAKPWYRPFAGHLIMIVRKK